ncbi:transposase [Ornithinibacillus gellani]|nr:transposase [Ornithinibacillus gellani]
MIIHIWKRCSERLSIDQNFPTRALHHASLEEARKWASQFVTWYNEIHLHSSLNFVTPIQCHNGTYRDVLANRVTVYEKAKNKHPERWARDIRDWSPHKQVALNPMQEEEVNSVSS